MLTWLISRLRRTGTPMSYSLIPLVFFCAACPQEPKLDADLGLEHDLGSQVMSTCTDGKKNGDEVDVDCGGSCGRCPELETFIGIAPKEGPAGGNTKVILTGTAFKAPDAYKIRFGNTPTARSILRNDRELEVLTGAASQAGVVDVVLGLPSGKNLVLPNAYRYFWTVVGLRAPVEVVEMGATEGAVLIDLSGDGKLDIATVQFSATQNVSVYLNDGNGAFPKANRFTAGMAPARLAAGDLNGDGKPDLIVGNFGSGTISVLLNNGLGSFPSSVAYAVGSNLVGVAVADFDGDGKPDVASSNRSPMPQIGILINRGDGTLKAPMFYPAGPGSYDLSVADINGDGAPDLLASNLFDTSVSAFENKRDGTFPNRKDIPIPFSALLVLGRDINGDKKVDLIAGSNFGTGLVYLQGNGDGTFLGAQEIILPAGVGGFDAADLNFDGHLDLVVSTDLGVQFLLGKGDGTFLAPIQNGNSLSGYSCRIGDINADGKLDVITTSGMGMRVFGGTAL